MLNQLQKEFNEKVRENDLVIILKTDIGNYRVYSVDGDWNYHCSPEGQSLDSFNRRSFAGCNDKDWDNLLEQAGIRRFNKVETVDVSDIPDAGIELNLS